MPQTRYFIGLISGTSVDGIDAGLFSFSENTIKLEAHHSGDIPSDVRDEILSLSLPTTNEIDRMGKLDISLGELFAHTALALIEKSNKKAKDITAIGSHGQTIRHRPQSQQHPKAFTLQIGDPNTIAELTGICTVADVRRRDIAAGGQGAPLAPAFHQAAFGNDDETRAVVNIGGMSNISVLGNKTSATLPATIGYDTGPGNVLMDAWISRHKNLGYDANGDWAATGTVNNQLLEQLLTHDFFALAPPKSTGRESFNIEWLDEHLNAFKNIKEEDVQASLCALTAQCIADAAQQYSVDAIYLCGGGAHNKQLQKELSMRLSTTKIDTTEVLGISPDWVEAGLCAWIAKQTLDGLPGNLPSVTGAKHSVPLGAIYPARYSAE